ncbi:MAG: hypothetical protein ACI9JN_002247 [Bacteroidia bacterium]|jgi:hypothetical protein
MRMLCIIVVLTGFGFQSVYGQTKKIANASHSSKRATFDWTSSDNLGAIMDYEEIRRYTIQIDSNTSSDSCVTIDTLSQDSLTIIFEESLIIETNIPSETRKIWKLKFLNRSQIKDTVKPKSKRSNKKGLRDEIINSPKVFHKKEQGTSYKSLFYLLLLPVGYLMIKKS